MAAPSNIDQVASSLVVALSDSPPGEITEAAVDLLGPFSGSDRELIGSKAVALGADPSSVQMAIIAAGAADSGETIEVTGKIPKIPMKPMIPLWIIILVGGGLSYYLYKEYKKR